MKRSIHSIFAATMLIMLAMTGQAAATPPSNTTDMDNTAQYEEQQEEQAVEDESQTLPVNSSEDAPSDDVSGTMTAEEDDTSTARTNKPSENRTFKSELKHALLGLLLPAVERRVRKATDSDSAYEPESKP